MTTTNPEPVTTPTITLETGRLYERGDINWLPAEVQAKFTSPEEGAILRLKGCWTTEGDATGILLDHSGPGTFGGVGYPIKPGTYPVVVWVGYYRPPAEEDGEETQINEQRTTINLVVTGEPLGTWYDRDVLGHYHPDLPAHDTRITAAQNAAAGAATAAATAQTAADTAQSRGDSAAADALNNKEENDRQGGRIRDLTTRVTTAEGKILAIEESIANSRD